MNQRRKSVDGVPVEHDVHLDQLRSPVPDGVVVKRGVSARNGLKAVVKIKHDFGQGHVEVELDAVGREVVLAGDHAALVDAQRHHRAHVVRLRDDLGLDEGLFDAVKARRIGVVRGVRHEERLVDVGLGVGEVRHVGHRRNHGHIELALQAFLHDFHVEHAEESAAEPKPKRRRGLGLKRERRVVQAQFFKGGTEFLKLLGLDRINSGKHHRLDVFKARHRRLGGVGHRRNGVADLDLFGFFDAADDVAHVAGRDVVPRLLVEAQDADFVGKIRLARGHELDRLAFANDAVLHAKDGLNSAERVVHAVKDDRLQRGVGIAFGCWNAVHNRVEQFGHAQAGLGRHPQNVFALAADQVDDLVFNFLGVGARQVHLVEHRNDFQIVLDGQIEVADGLSLNALGRVDHEQGALAGRDAAAHLVAEVYVARGVNQVDAKLLGPALVVHLDGVALDGDAALALQIHVVEELVHLLARRHALGYVEQAVGQGALTVVDVGDDAEVPNVVHEGCKGNLGRSLLFFGTSDICAWPHRNAPPWAADSPRS